MDQEGQEPSYLIASSSPQPIPEKVGVKLLVTLLLFPVWAVVWGLIALLYVPVAALFTEQGVLPRALYRLWKWLTPWEMYS